MIMFTFWPTLSLKAKPARALTQSTFARGVRVYITSAGVPEHKDTHGSWPQIILKIGDMYIGIRT